jgi:hypothetical protein
MIEVGGVQDSDYVERGGGLKGTCSSLDAATPAIWIEIPASPAAFRWQTRAIYE